MSNLLFDFLIDSEGALLGAVKRLVPIVVFILAFGLLIKRRAMLDDMRRAFLTSGLTLQILAFNLVVTPHALTLGAQSLTLTFWSLGLPLIDHEFWATVPSILVVFLVILVADFVSYWRHRLEHSQLFWPSHAVHHSETTMTWLTRERFHPIDQALTLFVDGGVLLLLGFPAYAIVANFLFRTYYGYLAHADLPWTYGRLGRVFVSPAMHRWHHAADKDAHNTNFAGVFSIFDLIFGTYRVPGVCTAPLGVSDALPPTLTGQLGYAFTPRAYRRGVSRRERPKAARPGRTIV